MGGATRSPSARSAISNAVAASTRKQVDQSDEYRSSYDRPHDGKGLPVDENDQQLRQSQGVGQEGPQQGSDESDGNGDDEAAGRSTTDGASDCAADSCDDEEYQEARECERHGADRLQELHP